MADLSWGQLAPAVWFAALAYAGPMALAALGELAAERSGVLNLGLEGVLAAGALAACGTSAATGNPWWGLAAGLAVGVALGALHALLVVDLRADQLLAGLGVTLGATGLAAFAGPLWLERLPSPVWLPELPRGVFTPALGRSVSTWLALGATAALAWGLAATRLGLSIRASGDAPDAALALGVPVKGLRRFCTAAGGGLGGLAGAFLALGYARTWTSTLPNGLGWMVIAVVPLSGWSPWRALGWCLLLAGVGAVQLRLQLLGVRVSSSLLATLPYLATLVAVVAGRALRRGAPPAREPAALGRPLDG